MDTVKITDARSIRALAHPARLAVIEELYSGGELTATECAEIVGLSPSAMSYHLRSLEKAGIVERAEASGDGRERPWRAAGANLQVESDSLVAESMALGATVIGRLNEHFNRWLERRQQDDKRWRDAVIMGAGQLWLRVDELEQFGTAVEEIVEQYRGRASGERPDDARRVRLALFAFPADKPRGNRT